jgi:hypothetical protein
MKCDLETSNKIGIALELLGGYINKFHAFIVNQSPHYETLFEAQDELELLKQQKEAIDFCIKNNGCEGIITDEDNCKFCFMREYCNEVNK